ncbi:protein O-GlcNAcase-like [Phaethornis superciliosus]
MAERPPFLCGVVEGRSLRGCGWGRCLTWALQGLLACSTQSEEGLGKAARTRGEAGIRAAFAFRSKVLGELYRMCRESLDCDPKVAKILADHPDLLGDRLLGSFLSLSPKYTFVLEDESGLCGYAAGALCAEDFLQQRNSSWLPAIQHKYAQDLGAGAPALGQDALEEALLFFHSEPPAVPLPVLQLFPSLVQLGTAPRVLDMGASHSLAICLLSALRANGSRGVFCQVSATDRQQLSFYNKLGFVALPVSWGNSPGTRFLGCLL